VLDDVSIRRPPALSIRDLSFTYPGAGEPALNGLDIELEAGQTLGIFGKTGAGKSTFVNLLTRVYTPPPKAIYLDGHDICDLALDRVRSAMAVVPQTPFLFSTTLRDNIILPEETDHEHSFGAESRLKYVLEAASLQDDVGQLPHGLDTIVGERGVMLSGGQRQRAALARALYRARPLLVLDDVLSAVDQTTETRLVKAIRALQGDPETGRKPTTIIVSHRTSVLEHADMIVVLDRGRIVGRGTHRDLLAQGGMYADTHAHQGGDG
jgi:ATP-binding cassette subfamily B protein